MARRTNTNSTASNFVALTLILTSVAALLFSGALFFDAPFLSDLMDVSNASRYGIAGGAAAGAVLTTLGAAKALSIPHEEVLKSQEKTKQGLEKQIKMQKEMSKDREFDYEHENSRFSDRVESRGRKDGSWKKSTRERPSGDRNIDF